jgi:octaprenyl-diphosphate synthase
MIDRDVRFDVDKADDGNVQFNRLPTTEVLSFSGNIPINRSIDREQLRHQVVNCVGDALSSVEHRILNALDSQHSEVRHLSAKASSTGGKRLRPMLVLLSAQAAAADAQQPSSSDQNDLIRIATSIELVHTASLVHDDVMDQADSRRHQPTLYHISGNSVAILLGDFLFTKAYATAAQCRSPLIARRIAHSATQLCEGELRQQLSTGNWQICIDDYFSILNQKTASLCSTGCRLGAWQVGASTLRQQALQRFGKWVGLAFQIYDDWLDYWGTNQTGKTLGTDLTQKKPTLPLIYFLRQCTPAQREEFNRLVSSGAAGNGDAGNIEKVRRWICESSANEKTLKTSRELAARAVRCLQDLPPSPAKSALESIALFSVCRSA